MPLMNGRGRVGRSGLLRLDAVGAWPGGHGAGRADAGGAVFDVPVSPFAVAGRPPMRWVALRTRGGFSGKRVYADADGSKAAGRVAIARSEFDQNRWPPSRRRPLRSVPPWSAEPGAAR
ncbi:hypothetical protein GCM10018772_15230 [Streptomyces fumanus]|uniref:Uncharacterized protein n=1 Tax=Streptomyces fumanus TaxID=67302 RepID=A0A919DY39_9ACTN|nr:hypothetical protein GCM10018772_15230 [Streptomyces fumanus]